MSARGKSNRNGYSFRNRARLVHGGHAYFSEMERMILAAVETIHLQTYIYEEDLTGNRIAELLMAAARRGVEV